MDESNTKFIQERNSGGRKGFFYDKERGGYVPAGSKDVRKDPEQVNKFVSWVKEHKRIVLIVAAIIITIGLIVFIRIKEMKLSQGKDVKAGGKSGE